MAVATKKTKAQFVSSDIFVRSYLESENVEQLCKTIGMTPNSARARIRKLSKAGVNLPRFARANRAEQPDVLALNALIAAKNKAVKAKK